MKPILTTIIILSLFLNNACEKSRLNPESEKLNLFFKSQWDEGLKDSPESATWYGDDRYNHLLNNRSLTWILKSQEKTILALKKLKAINRKKLLPEAQLNYDLYKLNLERSIKGFPFHSYLKPVNQLGGVHIGFPNMVDLMPFKTEKDYQNYLSRLEQIPIAIDQTIEVMKQGIKEGMVPPRVTLESVPGQIRKQFEFLSITDCPFYRPFQENSNNIKNWQEIVEKGTDLIQNGIFKSYQKFHLFFVAEYLPATRNDIAVSSLPNGAAYYEYLIQHHTTTQLSAKEIHDIGLSEVDRIHQEMVKVMKDSGWEGNFQDFLTFLRTDDQFYFDTEEKLLSGYREICKRADPELAKLFGTLPRTPYGVKPIPQYQAVSSPTAYYYGPSADGERPGYFWANTYNLKVRPKYEMEVLALHEAVPGHHLQIALANELENVPEFRKHSGYTAFVEGWGLYSESLGEEMGMYADPYSKFGQLTYEMWRACRLVIDTGIHSMGWTREQAINYMAENTAKTLYDIEVEIDRYIIWPGQALAYKIGELKIKELREKTEDILGDQFDIRDFHDQILKQGSIPLNILEDVIIEYIREKSNTTHV